MTDKLYLAIDPGREKCGLALVKKNAEPVLLQSVSVSQLDEILIKIAGQHDLDLIILGDGTGAEKIRKTVEKTLPYMKIVQVDEKDTTRTGRTLYWQYQPAKGWKRLLPEGLRVPDGPVDAYAALAIFHKWQEENNKNPENLLL